MHAIPAHAKIQLTQDGSPTLYWTNPDLSAEMMHHSGGAVSESFFIYDGALQEVLRRPRWRVAITSVGLGLAYNELIAIGRLLQTPRPDWTMISYESVAELRLGCSEWLEQSRNENPLHQTLDLVLRHVAQRLELPDALLKQAARAALLQGQWQLRGAFPEAIPPLSESTCVFYDAFSKKMNAHLWDEEKLVQSLRAVVPGPAVFATYAATGSLHRALHTLGFCLIRKVGFAGKRESTLAIRE